MLRVVHRGVRDRSGLWPERARIAYPEFSFGAVGKKEEEEEEEEGRPTPPLSLLQAPLSIQ